MKKKLINIEETNSLKAPNNLSSFKTDEILHRSMSDIYERKSSFRPYSETPKSIDTIRLESFRRQLSISKKMDDKSPHGLKPVCEVSLHTRIGRSKNSLDFSNQRILGDAKSASLSISNEISNDETSSFKINKNVIENKFLG